MAKKEKTTSELSSEIQKQIASSQSLRNRMGGLADEIHVLKKELSDFKKQVSNDLNEVVNGLQTIAKQKK